MSQKLCANKNCKNEGKHLCSGCAEESYCSKECQKSHWVTHKSECKAAVKPQEAISAQSFESLSIKQLKNALKAKAATFDSTKRQQVLEELERLVEKPALVKFVSEHMKLAEVEVLLTSSTATSSSKSSSSSSSKPKKTSRSNIPTPTPEQLREQAIMMRKNPDVVRRANPAFAAMTDEQIRQYADQLELAAADPNMLKEIEKMSKLSEKDRKRLTDIQEGLSGMREMDSAWADSTIDSLKKNPALFKSMFKGKGAMVGGISDEQIDSFIDMGAAMDAKTLKMIFNIVKYLASSAKPLMEYYKVLDTYTLGLAKWVLLAILSVAIYYWAVFCWFVLRSIWGLIVGTKAAAATAAVGSSAAAGAAGASGISVASFDEVAADPLTAAVSATGAAIAGSVGAAATAAASSFTASLSGEKVKPRVESVQDEFEF